MINSFELHVKLRENLQLRLALLNAHNLNGRPTSRFATRRQMLRNL